MRYFVKEDSVVRKIWGNPDTILFIFAGASAEFALNKAVDWLYFTGRLPADPIGRLFSTVGYAKKIVFSGHEDALRAIDQITAIHKNVEANRGAKIPDWAYCDVLYMLIDYSIRAFEVLERKMTEVEKTEVFEVFNAVGLRMGINGLPQNYSDWKESRDLHLETNMAYGALTADLYKQYRKHLGAVRFAILKQAQNLIAPPQVKKLLSLKGVKLLVPVIAVYKICRLFKLDGPVKDLILPTRYKEQILALKVG
ncbi:oxygenase MpaB family protein [Daejeonella sp.]|uniref:oxygenase MpaB family protein n=1 Tax=Daejeonella sp. TaxID=2805397 RepID=UPI0030C12148